MKKSIIKIGVRPTDYKGLSVLGQQVKAALTANAGLYPTPNPTLVTLAMHLTALDACRAKWAHENNRGSQADLIALKVAATDVRNDLLQLAAYVVNTVDNTLPNDVQLANLNASGFMVKHPHTKGLTYSPVFKLRIMTRKNVVEPNVYLKWNKPQELLKGKPVQSYSVYKNGVFMQTTTRTNLTVQRPTGTANDIYTIRAVNDNGEGASCNIPVAAKGA